MFVSLFERYGYVAIFLASLIEPEATLLTASFLSHRAYFPIEPVVLLVILGTLTASESCFWIARRQHSSAFAKRIQSPTITARLDRYGLGLVLASRFLWGFRVAIAATCGLSRMSAAAFFIADLTGAIIWALVTSLVGTALGHALVFVVDDLRKQEWWIADGIFVITTGAMIWYLIRRRMTVSSQSSRDARR